MIAPRIEPLGDGALIVRFGDRVDAALNDAALGAAEVLRAAALPGVTDVAPAYASVGLRYDVAQWAAPQGGDAHAAIAARIADVLRTPHASPPHAPIAEMDIPVCYGGEFGPDLEEVAAHCGLDADAVVARHAGAGYRVAMLGFMPGFAYLLGLDAALHTPRRASPRTRVPAGSVAIGGAQTGVYPRELPGGWQLIGRTPLSLFDPARAAPALLRPGQRVRFRPIPPGDFAAAR